MNGEFMHSSKEQVDDDLFQDLSASSDLEFAEYNRHAHHNTAPIGRFGWVTVISFEWALFHHSKTPQVLEPEF